MEIKPLAKYTGTSGILISGTADIRHFKTFKLRVLSNG